jgi:hypothetical protein
MIAEKLGWGLSIVGTALWAYGYFAGGLPALVDWPALVPEWIAEFLPNMQAEIGFALMILGSVPVYWAMWAQAKATRKSHHPSDH